MICRCSHLELGDEALTEFCAFWTEKRVGGMVMAMAMTMMRASGLDLAEVLPVTL